MLNTPLENAFLGVDKSLSGKCWVEKNYNERNSLALSQKFSLPEIIGRLLDSRGIGHDGVNNFLEPRLSSSLPNPSHLIDLNVGVKRIIEAINLGDKITIFGDYDVDGATSTALLVRYFNLIGIDCGIYIPDRIKEGYGPNINAFKRLINDGTKLLITVDCGTTAFEPLSYAKENGLDVIVIDHHIAEVRLPEALAIINPNRLDETSEHTQLAAVGVSFLLIVGLNKALRDNGFFSNETKISEPNLMELIDIVALGTVADMVALTGVNRALVVQGLKVLAKRQNAGLAALADVSRIDEVPTSYHLGFLLGPRVNAGGRVGESNLGALLLSTDSNDKAKEIAEKLNQYNLERKEIEANVLDEALKIAEERVKDRSGHSIVLVAGENWHPGVIGIIASRLKEKYSLPACVLTSKDGKMTGSGRSVSGIDLGACVIAARQAGIIENGGGHAMAAGFTLASNKLEIFEEFLSERISKQIQSQKIVPKLNIDALLTLDGATEEFVSLLQKMGPFGSGNPEPRIAFEAVRIVKASIVGNDHVRCFLTGINSKKSLSAIAFRCVDSSLGKALLQNNGVPVHVAGKLRENNWQGRTTVQFLMDDASLV
ncbi:MAG: single-stranded-DNA-specific exonuclease RecJ [Rhodospirillaceae bacterium]|nr:single-stranded-DNA-specific exonuclease RecJ [Rhodospirillaceae bacterium]OUT80368.1 MAG: single-stranded-DNA-specific exonuclease RecJ [Rhodospirillaceae bacterium TMED23]|tara:strand:+ start:65075 stop:66874 length:1800 start_codon:yes stop_codon:yes gene_type:complete